MKRRSFIIVLVFLILISLLIAGGGYFYNRSLSLNDEKDEKESNHFPNSGEVVCNLDTDENITSNTIIMKYDDNIVYDTKNDMVVTGEKEVLDTYELMFEAMTVLTLDVNGINLNVARGTDSINYSLSINYDNLDYDKLEENAEAQVQDQAQGAGDVRTSINFAFDPREGDVTLNKMLEYFEVNEENCSVR